MKKRLWRLGMMVLAMLLWAGVALAQEPASPDIAYLLALQGLRESAGGWLTQLMKLFTALGESALPVLTAAVLFWCVDKRAGERVMCLDAMGHLVNQAMKISFCVYRPWVRDGRITPAAGAMTTATGYSFPSGHTANGGAWTMGLGLYLRGKCQTRRGQWLTLAGLTLVWLLVGFSRNFLGVHTPQDVVVMILVMLPLVWLSGKAMDYAGQGRQQELVVAGGMALASAALILYALVKPFPMDYTADGTLLVDPAKMVVDTFSTAGLGLGFALGWLWERRLISFRVEGKVWVRMLRAAVGIALLLGFQKLLKPIAALLGAQWGELVSSALLVLFVMAGYPLLIHWAQQAADKRRGAAAGGRAQG